MNNEHVSKDNLYKSLLLKSQGLEYTLNKANLAVMQNPNALPTQLENIKNSVFELVAFYEAFQISLPKVSKEYTTLMFSWNEFVDALKRYQKFTLTKIMQMDLGRKLQSFKEANVLLISSLSTLI